MKRSLAWACFGIALLWLFCPSQVTAQDMAFNGDFETGSYSHGWSLFGGNTSTTVALFQTKLGVNSLCLKRMPGYSTNNGGIEQDVHLIAGQTYLFFANIATYETG
ncbi:MAG: hypothetical protein ACYTG7_02085 [Planctomycetota bacterium]|jgi:hypothetical protein